MATDVGTILVIILDIVVTHVLVIITGVVPGVEAQAGIMTTIMGTIIIMGTIMIMGMVVGIIDKRFNLNSLELGLG
jgi:hypothetical protein